MQPSNTITFSVGDYVIQAEPAVRTEIASRGLGTTVFDIPDRRFMDKPYRAVAIDGPFVVLAELEPPPYGDHAPYRWVVDTRQYALRRVERSFVEAALGRTVPAEAVPASSAPAPTVSEVDLAPESAPPSSFGT